jgi:hypothetical protein
MQFPLPSTAAVLQMPHPRALSRTAPDSGRSSRPEWRWGVGWRLLTPAPGVYLRKSLSLIDHLTPHLTCRGAVSVRELTAVYMFPGTVTLNTVAD